MWAMVTISLCSRREEQQERLSDKTALGRQLRGAKAEWQPIHVWWRLSHNPVIHSNLYDDDAELHP